MTDLLTAVVRQVEQLPKGRQDDAARMLLTMLESDSSAYRLTNAQLQELDLAIEDVDAGHFASADQIRDVLGRPWA